MPKEDREGNVKIWSLEEIDALLSDSISTATPGKDNCEAQNEKTRRISNTRDDFFDPRPTYNANIQHNIKTTRVEHSPTGDTNLPSSGATENDKYRERFINRPVRNLEKTHEHNAVFGVNPEKPIEREGVIKRQSNFKHTQDLAPIPTLVSAEDILAQDAIEQKTKTGGIIDVAEREKKQEDKQLSELLNQIRLEGFDDTEEPAPKVDEYEVERELYERRKEKASKFTVNSAILPDAEQAANDTGEEIYSAPPSKKKSEKPEYSDENDEFRFADDKIRFTYALNKKYKATLTSLAVGSASLVGLIALGVIPLIKEGAMLDLFNGSGRLYLIFCAIAMVIGIFSGLKIIKKGFSSLFHLKLNAASCVAFAVAVTTIQLLVLFAADSTVLTSVPLYLTAGIASLVLYNAGEMLKYKRIRLNFDFLSETKPLFAVESISGEDEAFEIGRGLLLGEPDIKASFRTLFPSRFMELSSKRFVSDELSRKLIPIVILLSVVMGIITAVIHKEILMGFGAFVAAACIGMPASAYLADNAILYMISKKLVKSGAIISGYEAMDNCSGINAVALESSEIFDTSKCNIFGIKTFSSMRVDEAILFTAAMIIEAKAPLSGVFDSVILGRRELLPPVETLAYEDKLGLSAWIYNRRVLVGNRQLLINHNVEAPTKDFEKKYLHDGRCPLYLAIEGKIAAMFIVSYEGNTELSAPIRAIEKNGVTLLVKTADANITEELICSALRLVPSSTKVLNAVSGDIFGELKKEIKPSADAHILHDGSAYSMLTALYAVFSLGSFKNITMIMQTVGAAIGIAVTAVLAFFAGLLQIGPIQIVFYQVFWAAFTVILLKISNKH
ncbi:MAG: Silver exporting P-type ATPase [Firmicutes bacterium ADurb.Bin300]|nr:MAG: Silver exporting P-type ATPase [Firmicutes bacterium ADurb.Bin300]